MFEGNTFTIISPAHVLWLEILCSTQKDKRNDQSGLSMPVSELPKSK